MLLMEYVLPKVLLHLLMQVAITMQASLCQRNSLLQPFLSWTSWKMLSRFLSTILSIKHRLHNFISSSYINNHLPPTFTIWISRISLLSFESKNTLLTIHGHHSNKLRWWGVAAKTTHAMLTADLHVSHLQ